MTEEKKEVEKKKSEFMLIYNDIKTWLIKKQPEDILKFCIYVFIVLLLIKTAINFMLG